MSILSMIDARNALLEDLTLGDTEREEQLEMLEEQIYLRRQEESYDLPGIAESKGQCIQY